MVSCVAFLYLVKERAGSEFYQLELTLDFYKLLLAERCDN